MIIYSEVQYLEVLKSSGMMYETKGTNLVQNTMNGIPRAAYKSGLNFTSFLFSFFSFVIISSTMSTRVI